MPKNEEHRDYWRRQHRILAYYLAHEAWVRGLDCVALERAHLQTFLELRRFKDVHIKWPCSDVEPWFPVTVPVYANNDPNSIHSLYFSRLPIADSVFEGVMFTIDRIAAMPRRSPKTAMLIGPGSEDEFPDEATALSHLAQLAAGLIDPK